MSDGQAVGLKVCLKVGTERAGQNFDHTRNFVDTHDTLHCAHVQDHAALDWYRTTAHSTSSCCSRHWNALLVAQLNDTAHLIGMRRSTDNRRALSDHAFKCPVHVVWPPIATCFGGRLKVGCDGAESVHVVEKLRGELHDLRRRHASVCCAALDVYR